jgi:translation initiation factor 2B subunit (eIF-2B alpha/beta/delta family)/ADP-ribose pyrophosphatase YjhB (NUDIX family)
MPTFPSHWAACSGSIEPGETPWQAAKRELHEETNLENAQIEPEVQYGLYVNVPVQRRDGTNSMYRVYPFVVHLPDNFKLELLGTEHDETRFVTIKELEVLEPSIPELSTAFHHATCGSYDKSIPPVVREWASNRKDGAMAMAKQAMSLLTEHVEINASQMKMLRPSMVAITNALEMVTSQSKDPQQVLELLETESRLAVDRAVQALVSHIQQLSQTGKERLQTGNENNCDYKHTCHEFRIATFSRSSSLLATLTCVRKEIRNDPIIQVQIVCSRSHPGDEGMLMAKDLDTDAIDDDQLLSTISKYDLILIGADSLTDDDLVNKIGTKRLIQAARRNQVIVWCIADRWKIWEDMFPPPMEEIFESVPRSWIDRILL